MMITFCAKAIITPTSLASIGFIAPVTSPAGGGGLAEAAEQHVAERAVHRLRHELCEQRAGRADHVPAMIMAAFSSTKPSKPTARPVNAL